jgi:hypothetical protein
LSGSEVRAPVAGARKYTPFRLCVVRWLATEGPISERREQPFVMALAARKIEAEFQMQEPAGLEKKVDRIQESVSDLKRTSECSSRMSIASKQI